MLIASISIFIVYYILMINYYVNSNVTSISINAQNDVDNLKHFWKSTGFSPLGNMTTLQKYVLSTDEKINLAFIGALPNNAISHVRIHWLINLIRINASNQYDYKYLDELIFWMREQHLYPRFELMGTPINIYGKQYFNKSYTFWNYITTEIVNHYDTFFGRQELSKWKFETWNEPDLRGYNILNFTLAEYLDYVRAVSNAIRAYDEANIKLGGPAGLFKQESKHPLCWGLLEYCNNVISNTDCPIDYITFHKKGNASSKEILQEDLELLDVFIEKFPRLHKMPIANDEADILANWSRDEEWRGDVRYAAMIANVIINHYKEIVVKRKIQIEVLSNDNAFLNYHPFYFSQRTLLARFQMNNTRPPHVQFVPKPSYAVMGLLSLLGDRYLPTIEPQSTRIDSSSSSSIASAFAIRRYADLLTVFATKDRNDDSCHVATIISFCNDTVENNDVKTEVAIKFNNFPMDNCFYVIYILDNQRTNPFKEWKSAGSPVFPNRATRNKMRHVQGPYRKHRPTHFSNTTLNINLTLTLPTVALINICCRGLSDPPGSVTDLQVLNVTKNEVLLIWKDNKVKSKCIRSYEVEFQYSCSDLLSPSQFKLLRRPDSIYLSYQHRYVSPPLYSARPGLLQSSDTDGTDVVTPQQTDDAGICRKVYRVRPVDYWKRKGPYSKIVDI